MSDKEGVTSMTHNRTVRERVRVGVSELQVAIAGNGLLPAADTAACCCCCSSCAKKHTS
jgi:hypothetical protein